MAKNVARGGVVVHNDTVPTAAPSRRVVPDPGGNRAERRAAARRNRKSPTTVPGCEDSGGSGDE